MRRAADGMLKVASSALLTYEILPTELLTFDCRLVGQHCESEIRPRVIALRPKEEAPSAFLILSVMAQVSWPKCHNPGR